MKQKFDWSPYQQAVFQDIQSGVGNTIVVARAGASKTSTLVEGVKYIPRGLKALFVAFNTAIAKELDDRIGKSYCQCSTVHSCGLRAIKTKYSNIKIDPHKSSNLVNLFLTQKKKFKPNEKLTFETANNLVRVINLCRSTLQDSPSKIDEFIDTFDIDTLLLSRDEFIGTVSKLLYETFKNESCIDFSEMVSWAVLKPNLTIKQYDRVFIDELQDLTPAQLHIVVASCKPNGRILAVGDPRQVCYTWNGTDIDVIEKFTKRIKAKTLTLPISYRCAKSIVKLAQKIVPDIQAAPNAKEGIIHYIEEDQLFTKIKPGDFLLSRINAPLIYHCLKLIRAGIPANIQGRDIAKGLLFLVKKSEAEKLPEFAEWLEKWEASEVKRLKEKGRDPILIEDKANCLRNICNESRSLDSVRDNIAELFREGDDKKDRVIASSLHRAKGLERDRVFLLTKTLKIGSREEDNLRYIGITRAKNELFLVG